MESEKEENVMLEVGDFITVSTGTGKVLNAQRISESGESIESYLQRFDQPLKSVFIVSAISLDGSKHVVRIFNN